MVRTGDLTVSVINSINSLELLFEEDNFLIALLLSKSVYF
jgi:hypothetical protein